MTPVKFVAELSALRFSNVFNPYVDQCLVHDLDGAARSRASALTAMLERAAQTEVDSIWIGRDLGHRGGRRTGLALTDDIHLGNHARRWDLTIDRKTKGAPVAERTASVIWSVLDQISLPVFLWNVFPLHPFEQDNEFTNRAHNVRERRVGEEILDELIRQIKPKRLIGLGNDAERTSRRFVGECQVTKVRHPSYGGQREFLRQISDLYGVAENRLI